MSVMPHECKLSWGLGSKRFGDLDEVTRLRCRERDARLSERLHVIRLLMGGESQRETARVLNVSIATVRVWCVRQTVGSSA